MKKIISFLIIFVFVILFANPIDTFALDIESFSNDSIVSYKLDGASDIVNGLNKDQDCSGVLGDPNDENSVETCCFVCYNKSCRFPANSFCGGSEMLTSIVGINWGDEGKGRMVDLLSEQQDIVVRYQGGNNAGHTVINERGKFVLNLLPSGILRPEVVCVMVLR